MKGHRKNSEEATVTEAANEFEDISDSNVSDESNASEGEIFNPNRAVKPGFGYFSQKYYLLADDDVYVTIDPEKTYIKANEEYNASYAEYLYDYYQKLGDEHYAKYKDYSVDQLYERLNRIVDAMRFSILIKDGEEYSYTIIDPNYKEETLLGGVLDNAMDQYYDYYHKSSTNEYYERVYGEFVGQAEDPEGKPIGTPVYDEALASDSDLLEPDEAPNAFNARHKQGVRTFNLERSKNENNFRIKSEPAINLEDFKTGNPYHFPVYMDTPKEIVVSLYIEGWDLDSVNYTMGAAFNADLSFTIEREM
jgi:hypothetical protein